MKKPLRERIPKRLLCVQVVLVYVSCCAGLRRVSPSLDKGFVTRSLCKVASNAIPAVNNETDFGSGIPPTVPLVTVIDRLSIPLWLVKVVPGPVSKFALA